MTGKRNILKASPAIAGKRETQNRRQKGALVDANLRPVITVVFESYFNLRQGFRTKLFRSVAKYGCHGPIAKITHVLLNLEGGTSISLAIARVKRAGEVSLIRRKNNWYFIGGREITISLNA
jgi:hypothetical protein